MTVFSIQSRLGEVQSAIAAASQRTGVDFDYLMGQAQLESGMRADARARTSSATGLYQFIEQSWLGVVKQHGQEHGLGWAADSIRQTSSGRYVVSDPDTRRAILNLRNDASAASLMAAEHASDNRAGIERATGRAATGTDLYMAHFLGLGGAKSFLRTMQANPDASAANLFPAAARANRNIFYDGQGNARSVSEIYQRFSAKLDKGAQIAGASGSASGALDGSAPTQVATAEDARWTERVLAGMDAGERNAATVLRPTPQTARLAYMMLASLGG